MIAVLAIAGAVGAVARFVVDAAVVARDPRAREWGTAVVNVTGSLAAGAVAGLSLRGLLDPARAAVAASGFLGAYTTFSTFAFQVARLVQDGAVGRAVAYAAGSFVGGGLAAAAGLALAGLVGSG